MNFQYWSVAKIKKEMFYEVVMHCKKKSSKLRHQIKLEIVEKLSGILKYKHEDFFIIITEKCTGEKVFIAGKEISIRDLYTLSTQQFIFFILEEI